MPACLGHGPRPAACLLRSCMRSRAGEQRLSSGGGRAGDVLCKCKHSSCYMFRHLLQGPSLPGPGSAAQGSSGLRKKRVWCVGMGHAGCQAEARRQ